MICDISNEQRSALRELVEAAKDYRTYAAVFSEGHKTLRLNQALKAVEELFGLEL